MSAIIGRPEFIIRVSFSRTICAFALGLMQALEVNCNDDTSVRGRSAAIVSAFFINLTIDNEFLRNREWLDDDVCNINRGRANLEFVPGLALIERVKNLLSWLIMLCHYNKTTMVT